MSTIGGFFAAEWLARIPAPADFAHTYASYTQGYHPFFIVVLGTFIWHEIFWAAFNVPYMLIEDYDWFPQYRLQEKAKHTPSSERWQAFRGLIWDHCTQLLPLTALAFPLFQFFGVTTDANALPGWGKFWFQFLIFNILEDAGFYWVHRLLHTQWGFKNIHWKHHRLTTPYSLGGEIAHPAEFLFNFLLPMVSGPFLLGRYHGVHIVTFWTWICFRELRGVDAHSGYHLPFHPLRILAPIYGGASTHDFHHRHRGYKSNFGGYYFWDWLCGTDAKYNQFYQERKRAGDPLYQW